MTENPTTPIDQSPADLAARVQRAAARLPYQFDPALTEALSDEELADERALAEELRGHDRTFRRTEAAAVVAARTAELDARLAAARKMRELDAEIQDADISDLREARRALAAQRRAMSPTARLAELARTRRRASWALAGVMLVAMAISAVNVQHNIAPGTTASNIMWWFAYFVEALISVCLVVVMVIQPKLEEWEVNDQGRKIVAAEVALLAATVALNTFPHLAQRDWWAVGVHSVAPVMIAVAMLIHHAVSAGLARAMDAAAAAIPADDAALSPAAVYRPSQRLDIEPAYPHPRRSEPAPPQREPAPLGSEPAPPADEPAWAGSVEPAYPHPAEPAPAHPGGGEPAYPPMRVGEPARAHAEPAYAGARGGAGHREPETDPEPAPARPRSEAAPVTSAYAAGPEQDTDRAGSVEPAPPSVEPAPPVMSEAVTVPEAVAEPAPPQREPAPAPVEPAPHADEPAWAGSQPAPQPAPPAPETVAEPAPPESSGAAVSQSHVLAAGEVLARRPRLRASVEQVAQVIADHDAGASVTASVRHSGAHRDTVKAIRETLADIRTESGRVIALRSGGHR
ncbi:hypothetical protein [Nocardia sp. CC201C]|uniref:hypothetical protein n=1 Tax=Nocardia sp. CC201C TaxID=3044575 RepID=UPI0024A7C56E|nr:hypothetical protein [Nocardia sp. CC201C]